MRSTFDRKIVLEDGREFYGKSFGSRCDRVCEIVFNTSMAGYQEILSDLSYADQAVVMTYPLIGNYGMAEADYESDSPAIGALVVREYNDEPSNFRSEKTLGQVMETHGIPGISGVDTRALTRSIRDYGTRKALLTDAFVPVEKALAILRESALPTDAVSRVSCRETWRYPFAYTRDPKGSTAACERGFCACPSHDGTQDEDTQKAVCEVPDHHVVAIDCGMKKNILRSLHRRGCAVTVVPWNTSAQEIRSLRPDGVFISNGPGDPTDVPETIAAVRALIGEYPVFGICLGHQILSLAYGAKTYKLKFGHRGGNHPVKDLLTGKIEITSQNHSYAAQEESLRATPLEVTHINLLDDTIEGIACDRDGAFGVQYHPESAPGPQDSAYLFDRFVEMMR